MVETHQGCESKIDGEKALAQHGVKNFGISLSRLADIHLGANQQSTAVFAGLV
jgi:hypothetical protein